jgi:hypothetical protein
MKMLLMLAAVIMSGNVLAGERVILKDSKAMEVSVNYETVKCSQLGYGSSELKINIAALDGWTIFDHSNSTFGDLAGLPCMTAGACKRTPLTRGFVIEDVVQSNPRVETVVVNRVLTESRSETTDNEGVKICERQLVEKLDTIVGGITFRHQRSGAHQTLPIESCTF